MIAGVQSGWGKHLGRQTEADLMTAIKVGSASKFWKSRLTSPRQVTYSFIILSTLCLLYAMPNDEFLSIY